VRLLPTSLSSKSVGSATWDSTHCPTVAAVPHAGDSPQDSCKVCPAGTWAPGGDTQACRHCGFGYTGPEGATSRQQCFAVNACPAGTAYKDGADKATSVVDCVCKPGHGTAGSGTCRLCPAGTFAPGGSLDECTPCGFGLTSAEGSEHSSDCHAVAQICPIGQWVGQQAVSEKECRCYKGFGGEFGCCSRPCLSVAELLLGQV